MTAKQQRPAGRPPGQHFTPAKLRDLIEEVVNQDQRVPANRRRNKLIEDIVRYLAVLDPNRRAVMQRSTFNSIVARMKLEWRVKQQWLDIWASLPFEAPPSKFELIRFLDYPTDPTHE